MMDARPDRADGRAFLRSRLPEARHCIAQTIRNWRKDTDLARIRDAGTLAKLPEEERKAWRGLWDDVEALLKKAQGDRP